MMGGYITKDRRVLQTDDYIEYLQVENERLGTDRDRYGEALQRIVEEGTQHSWQACIARKALAGSVD